VQQDLEAMIATAALPHAFVTTPGIWFGNPEETAMLAAR